MFLFGVSEHFIILCCYTQMAFSLKELWIKLLSLKRTPGDKVLQGLHLCRHVISGTAKTVSYHTESPIGLRNPQV